jgi:hypothetical protein
MPSTAANRAIRAAAAAALVAAAGAVGAHHPGSDPGLSLAVAERTLAFHYRNERLDVRGRIAPALAGEGQEVDVTFSATWQGEAYLGPARVALADATGRRVEWPAASSGGSYHARIRAVLPDGDSVRVELLDTPGAGVVVPYEVRARVPLATYGLLGLLVVSGGLLLAWVGRAHVARRDGNPAAGGDAPRR